MQAEKQKVKPVTNAAEASAKTAEIIAKMENGEIDIKLGRMLILNLAQIRQYAVAQTNFHFKRNEVPDSEFLDLRNKCGVENVIKNGVDTKKNQQQEGQEQPVKDNVVDIKSKEAPVSEAQGQKPKTGLFRGMFEK